MMRQIKISELDIGTTFMLLPSGKQWVVTNKGDKYTSAEMIANPTKSGRKALWLKQIPSTRQVFIQEIENNI